MKQTKNRSMKNLTILLYLISLASYGQWVPLGDDMDGVTGNDQFGSSVSLSDDGSIVAVGAPFNDDNGISSGHVRIFENQSGDWVQLGNTIPGSDSNDKSGFSVRSTRPATRDSRTSISRCWPRAGPCTTRSCWHPSGWTRPILRSGTRG